MEILIALSMEQQILICLQQEHTQTLKPAMLWGIGSVENATALMSFDVACVVII